MKVTETKTEVQYFVNPLIDVNAKDDIEMQGVNFDPIVNSSEESIIDDRPLIPASLKDAMLFAGNKTTAVAAALVPGKVKKMMKNAHNGAIAFAKFATGIDSYENIIEIINDKKEVTLLTDNLTYVHKAKVAGAKVRDVFKEVVSGAAQLTLCIGVPVTGIAGKLATKAANTPGMIGETAAKLGMSPADAYTFRSFSETSVSVLTGIASGVANATSYVAPPAWKYAVKPVVQGTWDLVARYPGTTATLVASTILMRKGYRNINPKQFIKHKEPLGDGATVRRQFVKKEWDQTLKGVGQISAGLGLIALNLGYRGYGILHPKD